MSEKKIKQKEVAKVSFHPAVCKDSRGRVMFDIKSTAAVHLDLWSKKRYTKIKKPKDQDDFYDGDYIKIPDGEDITLHGEIPVCVTNNYNRTFYWRCNVEFLDYKGKVFYKSNSHLYFHATGRQNATLHSQDTLNSKDAIDFSRIQEINVVLNGPYQGNRDLTTIVFP